MGIIEIRESGLIELYAIGGATSEEIVIVERALLDFYRLKKDLYEIGEAMEVYARMYQVSNKLFCGKKDLMKCEVC